MAWVHAVAGQADMYNLTVASDHTYAVGDGHVVVHNVCGPTLAPDGSGGGSAQEDSIVFAHGTSLEYARSIESGGLSEDAARIASRGGLYGEPGSFFTFNVTESGPEAIQIAYEMGARQADQPVVLLGRLPRSVFDELVAGGHVEVSPIPGVDFPQTVFKPGAFAQLNESMGWWIRDPYGR